MLHKCANPVCTVPFRSLREGKLFLAETFPSDLAGALDGDRRKLRRREHFWLCNACSIRLTLRFDTNLGMADRPPQRPRSSTLPRGRRCQRLLMVQKAVMNYAITQRIPCSVCGLDTFRHTGWFLVVENRWLDRLKILSWHPSLSRQNDVQSVCCRQHLRTLIAYWLTQASLRLPPALRLPLPTGGDATLTDVAFGPRSVGRLVGELAVHRESFSSVWSGSPAALQCILDALVNIGAENKPHALKFQLPDPPESWHGLSLQ